MKVKQILNRFYVNDINKAIEFYEEILNEKCLLRFCYQQMKLELAQVGNILILGGSDEALKPFRDTKATFLIESITEAKEFLLDNQAIIIRDITKVPTGWNMTVKHADGTIVEYVEHNE
jgi:predicted enzyme related to lactoylglutathione lyase